MANKNNIDVTINSIISTAKNSSRVIGFANLGFYGNEVCNNFSHTYYNIHDSKNMINLLNTMFDYAVTHNISLVNACRLIYSVNDHICTVFRNDGINPDEWVHNKLKEIIQPEINKSDEISIRDTVYQDELNALTDEDCVKATINAVTEFINSDGSGTIKEIIGDEFTKLIVRLKTDDKAIKAAAAAFKKMASKIDSTPENSPEHASAMFDFFVEIGIMDEATNKFFKSMLNMASSTKQSKKEEKKPQPQKEQPKVAHDLRQQKPQGFDVGNFVQQPNPNEVVGQIKQEVKPVEAPKQYEGMKFNEKVEYVQKRINFIPKTHPKVGESWFDALITLISDPFIQSTLTNLGAVKNPRFYEAKTYDSENGKYDIAFNVNCIDDNNRIIVRYSTNLTQQPNGVLGYSFDAKVVAKK